MGFLKQSNRASKTALKKANEDYLKRKEEFRKEYKELTQKHQIDFIPVFKADFNKLEASVDYVDLKRVQQNPPK